VLLLLLCCAQMTLDNVVELLLNYGVPQLPFLPRPEPQPSPGLRLSLHHTYEVTPPNTVKIVFESTSAKAIGPDILQVGCGRQIEPTAQQQVCCWDCETWGAHGFILTRRCWHMQSLQPAQQ
jgi:hypothetical protein